MSVSPARLKVRLLGSLVLVVVVVIAMGAYAVVGAHDDGLSPGLRAYVGGEGVRYIPAGQGYSVRLPSAPVRRDQALSASHVELATTMHLSISSGADYSIRIRAFDLRDSAVFPHGLAEEVYDPAVGGNPAARRVRPLRYVGLPAYDFDVSDASGVAIRARVFQSGQHLYVIEAQAKSIDRVFDTLTASFGLTPDGR